MRDETTAQATRDAKRKSEIGVEGDSMSAKIAGVVAALAVGAAGYGLGRVRGAGNVVHADATPKWTKVSAPLEIKRDEDLGYVSTQGFWELTDASKDTLVPVAVRIECTEYNNTCGVVEACPRMASWSRTFSIITWRRGRGTELSRATSTMGRAD